MSTSGVGYEQLNAPLKAMINAGGGGTGGAGGSFIVAPQFSTVKLTQASNTVNTNLNNFNKDFDTLLTFKNSVYIGQGDSYNIISDTQIQSADKSNWEAGTVFQFVGLCVNRAPSVLKCVSIKNKIELTTSSTFIDVGVRDFDAAADTLLLFENGVYMEKDIDYRIDDSKIYPINETMYKGTTDCPLVFNMIVLRNVVDPDAVKDFEGDNIKDVSITMNKLTQDIQNILNNPKDKRVGNMSLLKTTKKDTLVNSINELFQSANNGKTLIANVIGEPTTSTLTFEQIKNNIQTCKNVMVEKLTEKNVSVSNTDNLLSLANAIGNIELINSSNAHLEVALGSWSYVKYDEYYHGDPLYEVFAHNPFINTDKKAVLTLLYVEGQLHIGNGSYRISRNILLEDPKQEKVLVWHAFLDANPWKYPDALFMMVYTD